MQVAIKKEPQPRVCALRLSTGAEDGTRTHDLLITNQLLYQLSHPSTYKNRTWILYIEILKNAMIFFFFT